VKVEIDRMLEVGIIETVEEYEWISLMVVQETKQGGISICVYFRKMNDAFLHDHFPTPLQMKSSRMWEARKHIYLQMDSHVTNGSKYLQRIGIRLFFLQNGDLANIQSCHLG
jgi:hypothetical protein